MALVDYVKSDSTPDTVAKMIQEASTYSTCGITMTQIRAIFGAVRRLDAMKEKGEIEEGKINSSIAVELRILESRIHYRIERFLESQGRSFPDDKRRKVELLRNELRTAISEVGMSRGKFKRFVEAFEAVVAYMPRK